MTRVEMKMSGGEDTPKMTVRYSWLFRSTTLG